MTKLVNISSKSHACLSSENSCHWGKIYVLFWSAFPWWCFKFFSVMNWSGMHFRPTPRGCICKIQMKLSTIWVWANNSHTVGLGRTEGLDFKAMYIQIKWFRRENQQKRTVWIKNRANDLISSPNSVINLPCDIGKIPFPLWSQCC